MEGFTWGWIIGGIIGLIINIIFCVKFKECAEDKGYDGTKYFWLCFFFGPIGYIFVAALPDIDTKNMIKQLQTEIRALKNNTSIADNSTTVPNSESNNIPTSSTINFNASWKCSKCGKTNNVNELYCTGCGEYR